jgi:hypothetical protein
VTNGTKTVQFNSQQKTPNGMLSQSFTTVPGATYTLTFDIAAYGYQTNLEERLRVTVVGNGATLVSQTISVFGQGTGTWWTSRSFTFVANHSSTTLTFTDVSVNTINTDVLLDNVRVVSGFSTPTPSPTPTPTPSPVVTPPATPRPSATPTPTATPAPAGLINGSFEQDYTGWNHTGNQDVVIGTASQGTKSARFNAAQKTPNAVLSQSFSTTPGRSYTLSFDYGVMSSLSLRQQRLQVTIQGTAVQVSQLITQSAFSSNVQYSPKVFSFTADKSTTTVTFTDVSVISDSVDSFIDNIQVK